MIARAPSSSLDAPRSNTPMRARLARLQADELFGYVVLGSTWVLSFVRLRYGVDFTDEAWYAAVTQRFVLGDRPYLDEVQLRQTANLLTVPLYYAYLKCVGSTDGVIYFLRVAYFSSVQLAVSWAAYRLACAHASRVAAIIIAAVPLAFMPFEIPTFSYNNIGGSMFALGSLVGLRATLEARSGRPLLAAGVIHGIACLGYPPLGPAVLLYSVCIYFTAPRAAAVSCARLSLAHAAGVALVAVLFLVGFLPSLLEGLPHMLGYETAITHPRDFTKFVRLLTWIAVLSPAYPLWLLAIVSAALLARHHLASRLYVFVALTLIAVLWCTHTHFDREDVLRRDVLSNHLVIYVALLGALFLPFSAQGALRRALWLLGWLPGVASGLIMSMSSDNLGSMNAGIGCFVAALVSMLGLARVQPTVTPPSRAARVVLASGLALVPAGMQANNYAFAYRDVPPLEADATVHTGPYLGLRGERRMVELAEELTLELRARVRPGERMLAYYATPAGYLFAAARPAFPITWTDAYESLPGLLPYYRRHRTGRGLVLVLHPTPSNWPELRALVEDPARLIKDAGRYQLYREPPP